MRDGRLFLGPLTKSWGPRNDRLSIARYELSTYASIRAAVGSSDVITTLSKLYLIRRGRKPVIKKPFAVEEYTGKWDEGRKRFIRARRIYLSRLNKLNI